MNNPLSIFLFFCTIIAAKADKNKQLGQYSFRYNIGGPAIQGYKGEKDSWISSPDTRTAFTNDPVFGDLPQFVLGTHRWAKKSFQISIPVSKSGLYRCELHWAETSTFFSVTGKRVFNVVLNGQRRNKIDVYKAVAEKTGYKKVFNAVKITSTLLISLEKKNGDPFLSGVLCVRTGPITTSNPSGLQSPIKINVGGPAINGYKAEKNSWLSSADTRTALTNEDVSGDLPSFVLGTHRWAKFSFKISIPVKVPGLYKCELYWAEISTFFAFKKEREFNVVVNNRKVNNINVNDAVGFRNGYSLYFDSVKVESIIEVSLEKVKGDPFLSGIICVLK